MSTSGSDLSDLGRGPAVKTRPFDETVLRAAGVYAEALLNAAALGGDVEEALRELGEIRRDIIERYPQFAMLLMSTSMSVEDKDRILASALEGRALPVVTNFLRVLNRNGRIELLGVVLERAYELWDQRQNRVYVNVRSAVPLDEPQLEAVKARLAGLLGEARPVLRTTVDPNLIGGLVIQVGDQLYDLSVRRRLQLLRGQLVDVKGAEVRATTALFLQH